MAKAKLIPPYGGKLVNLVAEGKERDELLASASKLPSIKITMRNLCDLELIASGGFSPLTTFMGKGDYERVLHEMRLSDGTLWPLPITLTADPKELPAVGEELVLRNANNDTIA
ncbi:adenylyltransferase, partial [bacterium]|nr:adenylyltransferase [bacterium]